VVLTVGSITSGPDEIPHDLLLGENATFGGVSNLSTNEMSVGLE
jgi:hypothetical protein